MLKIVSLTKNWTEISSVKAIWAGSIYFWLMLAGVSAEQLYFVDGTRPPDAFLALRSDPSGSGGQRLVKMPNGTKLKLIQRREDGWWLVKIYGTNITGWALSGQASKQWIHCCIDASKKVVSSQSGDNEITERQSSLEHNGDTAAQLRLPTQQTNLSLSEQTASNKSSIGASFLQRRAALIIANSNYTNVQKLPNPINDANLIASALHTAGFQSIIIKKDQSREDLILSIKNFSGLADESDWAVVYYSGHGIAFNGINYMIPIDAKLNSDRDIQLEAVDINSVIATLNGVKKLRIIILDMCRSNPFIPGIKRSIVTRSISRGLAAVEPETGVLTVFAAKDGQEALDGQGANSPFATALARRIITPNIEIRRLFDLVRDDVLETTAKKQQPFSYGSVSGKEDFFFIRN